MRISVHTYTLKDKSGRRSLPCVTSRLHFAKKTSLVRQACRILIVFLFFKIKKLCLSVFDQKFMILNRYSYLESVGRAAPDLGKAQNILSWVRPRLEKDPGLSR